MNSEIVAVLAHSAHVHFGDPAEGPFTSEEDILKAERRLGVRLPPSYRWWCKTFGGGEIGPYEIFSVYGGDDPVPSGDIVFVNEHAERAPGRLLVCIASEGDEEFWLDLSRSDPSGECPVVVRELGEEQDYAATFVDFLLSQAAHYSSAP